jgi:X-Pro dipeptidyl-peptidase
MRISLRTRLVASAGAATLMASIVSGAPSAMAADPPEIVVQDGVTQPVFGYTDAVKERVEVTSTVDTDNNGELDIVSFDIMRPRATEEGLKAPVIMDGALTTPPSAAATRASARTTLPATPRAT